MLGYLAAAAVLLFVVAGSSDSESSSGDGDSGKASDKLPISGRKRSDCPNVAIPIPSGSSKKPEDLDFADMRSDYREIYEAPMAVKDSDFGEGEAGKAMRQASVDSTRRLALEAECNGYLAAAKKLYAKADEIAGKTIASSTSTTSTTSTTVSSTAIAADATTPDTLARDLAELPEKLREYVYGAIFDPATTPEDLEDGATELVRGKPAGVAGVGRPKAPRVSLAALQKRAGVVGQKLLVGFSFPSMPSFDPSAYMPSSSEPSSSESSSGGSSDWWSTEDATPPIDEAFPEEQRKTWYYPTAASRLRRLAIERREATPST